MRKTLLSTKMITNFSHKNNKTKKYYRNMKLKIKYLKIKKMKLNY